MDERNYWLGFSCFRGLGQKTFQKLLGYFGSAKTAWSASKSDAISSGLSEVLATKFDQFRNTFSPTDYAKKLKDSGVFYLILTDKEYPVLLKQIKNPPFVLYIRGTYDFNDMNHQSILAIVGTRKITQYGRDVTAFLTRDLVAAGFTIVSGLAMGVDAVSHLTAIENQGKTIAVLGCGVDCCTPTTNQHIYNSIVKGNGLVVSEFPLGQPPMQGSFPSRNRIIAGLSLGVLVTEGAEDSGALITADYAFQNQRKVFAVPGPITSSLSKGPYKLLEKGAKLVTKVEDILQELKMQSANLKTTRLAGALAKRAAQNSKLKKIRGETREEQKILEILENEPLHFDEIVRRLGLDSARIGSMLSIMEVKGMVREVGGGVFGLS